MSYIRPNIGDTGVFTLATPYDSIVSDIEEYTVESIRGLQEMVDAGENPLQVVYLDLGRTEEDMKDDINNEINIVVLVNSAGQYAYIPEDAFIKAPDVTGIQYQEKAIGISLGLLKADIDLESLKDDIAAYVKDTLGIVPEIKEVETSAIVRLNKNTRESLELEREALRKNNPSFRARFLMCEAEKEKLASEVNRLGCSLSNYLADDMKAIYDKNKYAINIEGTLVDNAQTIVSDLDIGKSKGVEFDINRYLVFDRTDSKLKLIYTNTYSVTVLKEVAFSSDVDLSYTDVNIYKTINGVIVYFWYADRLVTVGFNNNLEETIQINASDLINENMSTPSQVRNDTVVFPYFDGSAIMIRYTTQRIDGTLSIANKQVSGGTVSGVLANTVGQLAELKSNSFVIFKNDGCRLTKDDSDEYTYIDNNVRLETTPNYRYFMSLVPDRYVVTRERTDGIEVFIVDETNTIVSTIIQVPYQYDKTVIINTHDKSLLFINRENTEEQYLSIKKII